MLCLVFFIFQSKQELAQQVGSLLKSVKCEKMVSKPRRRSGFETAVSKTEYSSAVQKADLPLAKFTYTEWFNVLYFALANYCNVSGVSFRELENFMKALDGDSFHVTVDFVLTNAPYNTRRSGNRPSSDHDVFLK